jgi:hypothetical protein
MRDVECLGVPHVDATCAQGRPGVWRTLYLGCVRAEVLRRSRVLDRPMRGMVEVILMCQRQKIYSCRALTF